MKLFFFTRLLAIILPLFLFNSLSAQLYKKTISWNSYLPVVSSCVKKSNGNNLILFRLDGTTSMMGSGVMEVTAAGDTVWMKTFNRAVDRGLRAMTMKEMPNGNICILINTYESVPRLYAGFIILDPVGNLITVQQVNALSSSPVDVTDMVVGPDNAIYISGNYVDLYSGGMVTYFYYPAFVARINPDFTLGWARSNGFYDYHDEETGIISKLAMGSDGNLVFAGFRNRPNSGLCYVHVIKADAITGYPIWSYEKQVTLNSAEIPYFSLEIAPNDDIYLGRRLTGVNATIGNSDLQIDKFSTSGTLIWSKVYGVPGIHTPVTRLGFDPVGNCLFAQAAGLMKLDTSGNVVFIKYLPSANLCRTANNNYLVSGTAGVFMQIGLDGSQACTDSTINITSATYTPNWSVGGFLIGMSATVSPISCIHPVAPFSLTTNCFSALPCQANAGNDVTLCNGDTIALDGSTTGGSGMFTYHWFPASGLSCTNCEDPLASPTSSTLYSMVITDTSGCSDTSTVLITVNNPTFSSQTMATCNSYTWPLNGNNYTSSGVYNATIPNSHGCDSVITLNLTIYNNTSSSQTASACTSYTWPVNGNNYTSSGVYNATIPNSHGCDSVITLNLTINNNTSSSQTVSACTSYTWPVNGNTYTSSGIYNATIPNSHGCDSVITLNLTIYNNTSSSQTVSACTSYTWPVNGNNYISSGIYNATIPNSHGCDSVITLNLTINNNTSSSQTTSACTSYTWPVNGNNYTSSGVYNATIPNSHGCDSVITLNLTINSNTSSSQSATACDNYIWSVNGNTYTSSGSYNATIPNASGCDSVITLNLTIHSFPFVTYTEINDTVCINYTAFPLNSGTPLGGIYSGTGVTGNNFDPAIAGVGNHMIIYEFTDANSCANSDTSFIRVNSCLGMGNDMNEPVVLFPNPNYGNFIITVPGTDPCMMKIYDYTGKLVMTDQLSAGDNPINLDAGCGMYFVYLFTSTNEETVIKLVIR